jgi:adenylate kinase
MGRRMCACGESYHIDFLNGSTTCSKCGGKLYQRDDDKEDVVKSRLDVYYKQTAPLIDYYKQLKLVSDVDGGRDKDIVIKDIYKILELL